MTASEQRPHPLADPAVRDAVRGLHRRFGPARPAALPPPEPPQAALGRLAGLWGTALHDMAGSPAAGAPEQGPLIPAVAVAEAERLGFVARLQPRSTDAIKGTDCPCLILTEDGRCRLALGLAQDGQIRIASAAGESLASSAALAGDHGGSILSLQRRDAPSRPGSEPFPPEAAATQPGRLAVRERLTQALADQKPLLVRMAVASLVINLLGLLLPLFSMVVFDRVIPHGAIETLWALALGIGLAMLVELGLRHVRLKLADAASLSVSHALQTRAMSRALGAPLAELPRGSGALVQPLNDIDNLAQAAPALLVGVAVDLPFFLILLALIGMLAGPIALAPLAATLLLVAVHAAAHRAGHGAHARQGGLIRRQQQLVIDSLAAGERVRATGAGRLFLGRFAVAADEAGFAGHVARYWHGLAAQAAAVIVQATIVATIVAGVYRIESAAMTIGALSAVIMLVNRAMMPVSLVTGLFFRVMHGLDAVAPVAPLLEGDVEQGGDRRALPAEAVSGAVDARGLTFRHAGEARDIVRDVSFSMRPGERIGLIGKTGSGKSTLLKLLVRLHDPSGGALRLDDRDLRHYDPATLRQAIGYMPQQAELVDATLEENMTLGLPAPDAARFGEIARISGVHDFARAHPQGYSLRVGPGGQRLSGGERQAASLARALMGRPRLLLLDEPTSALDNAAEARLIRDLSAHLGETGLIVATHRLQLLALVDRLIWMDEGRIVADGPKAEVLGRLGVAA